ncbi:hypothetical protein ACIROD_18655 [Peribacillus sp. NPDC101481]|uniref:hypothetical protein n=1 Tax=Peribacillus sp. NPDC101481 TaxID=3364403 RepID=UPI0038008308
MKSSNTIVWINVFTAKPGKLDELVAIQAEELLNFKKDHKVFLVGSAVVGIVL